MRSNSSGFGDDQATDERQMCGNALHATRPTFPDLEPESSVIRGIRAGGREEESGEEREEEGNKGTILWLGLGLGLEQKGSKKPQKTINIGELKQSPMCEGFRRFRENLKYRRVLHSQLLLNKRQQQTRERKIERRGYMSHERQLRPPDLCQHSSNTTPHEMKAGGSCLNQGPLRFKPTFI